MLASSRCRKYYTGIMEYFFNFDKLGYLKGLNQGS